MSTMRTLAPWLLAALLLGLALALPPIAQPMQYHAFADQRACPGMFSFLPNCLDTVSNALFTLVGIIGLLFLRGEMGQRAAQWHRVFFNPQEAWPYALFFVALILLGFASGYYHLAPDNAGLAWDRAAMALAFMAWFAAILCERISPRAGLTLLPVLLVAGLGSVAWWYWSETQGMGDLRFYIVMQLTPILLVPLLLWLYPPRYDDGRDIMVVIGLYLLALLFDFTDRPVFALTGGLVSGHTLKHVVAALAALWVVRYLHRRKAAIP
jgi:predicted membrane channel-forming protein YqfA (hemolysin III family)